jgi:hypothetical protein
MRRTNIVTCILELTDSIEFSLKSAQIAGIFKKSNNLYENIYEIVNDYDGKKARESG